MIAESSAFETLLNPILTVIGVAVAGFVLLLLEKARRWLGLKAYKEDVEAQRAEEALVRDIIERSVTRTLQTFVAEVKNSAADGKLSKEEAIEALSRAKQIAQSELAKLGKNRTAQFLSKDIQELVGRIEAAIPGIKKRTSSEMKVFKVEEADT